MNSITVFTTTYNRANLLKRVYDSLCRQTIKNFEWLIIDDGSTDETNQIVNKWVEKGHIKIRYIYKENGGVHTARNFAYNNIYSDLCFQVDSDDWLVDDAVETVINLWLKHGGKHISWIVGLCKFQSGEIIGSYLPEIISAPFRQLSTKYRVTGDKSYVFRTEMMKRIPEYPVFENENRVPIAWKYSQIPDENEILILNKALCFVEYQPEGISAGIRKQYFKNPKGMAAGYEMVLRNSIGLKQLVQSGIKYCSFSMLANNEKFISRSPKPVITFLLLPFGVIGFYYINIRWGKYKNKK